MPQIAALIWKFYFKIKVNSVLLYSCRAGELALKDLILFETLRWLLYLMISHLLLHNCKGSLVTPYGGGGGGISVFMQTSSAKKTVLMNVTLNVRTSLCDLALLSIHVWLLVCFYLLVGSTQCIFMYTLKEVCGKAEQLRDGRKWINIIRLEIYFKLRGLLVVLNGNKICVMLVWMVFTSSSENSEPNDLTE
jgi:hypothetical protein